MIMNRYREKLNPNLNKSAWTNEELSIMRNAHKKLDNKHAQTAKLLPGRARRRPGNSFAV